MPKRIDDIEIKEPPIEELSKKHSCFRRTCLSCCSFIFVIIAVSLIILKFTTGPKVEQIKKLPPEFAKAIPVYDKENIELITVTSGKERIQSVERIAYIPKLIIVPLLVKFDKQNFFINKYRPNIGGQLKNTEKFWDKVFLLMKEPVGDHRDIIKIEWKALSAEPKFIKSYYKAELTKKQFDIELTSDSLDITQFSFEKDGIDGGLYIQNDPKTPETDYIVLSVNIKLESKQ